MRIGLLAVSMLSAAAVLVFSSVAAGGGMQPNLGAKLAGMGEHGVVNLHVTAKSKKLCWTFDMGTMKGFTAASIHAGNKKTVLLRLGMHYARKGCTTASAMTLDHLQSKPAAYWVFVDTKGHPGDLRGKLFAGMAHM